MPQRQASGWLEVFGVPIPSKYELVVLAGGEKVTWFSFLMLILKPASIYFYFAMRVLGYLSHRSVFELS